MLPGFHPRELPDAKQVRHIGTKASPNPLTRD